MYALKHFFGLKIRMIRTKNIILKKRRIKNKEIFLQELKSKRPIFIGTKNIFKPKKYFIRGFSSIFMGIILDWFSMLKHESSDDRRMWLSI